MTDKNTEEFVKKYHELKDVIFRHLYFRLSNREKAQDLVQETFAKTWVCVRDGKEIKNLRAFLYKVANNLIIDEYRKKKAVSLDVLRLEGFDPPDGHFDTAVFRAEFANALKFVNRLEVKYKQVVIMRYVDSLSPREIAEKIKETENSVSVKINRGLSKIKNWLREKELEAEKNIAKRKGLES